MKLKEKIEIKISSITQNLSHNNLFKIDNTYIVIWILRDLLLKAEKYKKNVFLFKFEKLKFLTKGTTRMRENLTLLIV